jgi:hypothetical protein
METIIEQVQQEVLNTMKRGLRPSLLVLGENRYKALQQESYGHTNTTIAQVAMLGFELRLVVVPHDHVLEVYGQHPLPQAADIPELPFLFQMAPDANLQAALYYDLCPGHLYVAVDQRLDLNHSTYSIKPQGRNCWIPSTEIIEVPHISVN